MRRLLILTMTLLLLVGIVPAALAGGWAAVILDELPGEVHSGETQTIGFRVLQHGETPVHNLGGDEFPVEPLLVATEQTSGERIQAEAQPTKEIGHFVVRVTFPSEGTWAWSIEPRPFPAATEFEPLTVLPAMNAAAAAVKTDSEPAAAAHDTAAPQTSLSSALLEPEVKAPPVTENKVAPVAEPPVASVEAQPGLTVPPLAQLGLRVGALLLAGIAVLLAFLGMRNQTARARTE